MYIYIYVKMYIYLYIYQILHIVQNYKIRLCNFMIFFSNVTIPLLDSDQVFLVDSQHPTVLPTESRFWRWRYTKKTEHPKRKLSL